MGSQSHTLRRKVGRNRSNFGLLRYILLDSTKSIWFSVLKRRRVRQNDPHTISVSRQRHVQFYQFPHSFTSNVDKTFSFTREELQCQSRMYSHQRMSIYTKAVCSSQSNR